MALPPIIVDLTRLATRIGRAVPNGIDRVDLAYAHHFLTRSSASLGTMMGLTGTPRLISRPAALALVKSVAAGWGESGPGNPQTSNESDATPHDRAPAGQHTNRLQRTLRAAQTFDSQWFGRHGVWPGQNFVRHAPRGAVYLNVSQFPIWRPGYLSVLDQRPDIRAAFFLHDLLPIQYPEFFQPFETRRHLGRLETIAARAAAVLVASDSTRRALDNYMQSRGRRAPQVQVVPLQAISSFARRAALDLGQGRGIEQPYFVCIGTLEPRKNHLLLLHIWRELVAELGMRTPKLVLIGIRGWENENVFDMLERCPALQGTVVQLDRLPTPQLLTILSGSLALLMPTFAEGFGLPVVEANALGVPVIASDIDVFRGHSLTQTELIDPLDGISWLMAIKRHLTNAREAIDSTEIEANLPTTLHFDHVEQFITEINNRDVR